jgi:hypothetical protein
MQAAAEAGIGQLKDPPSQDGQAADGKEPLGPLDVPLPYILGDDGKKQPLPGVQSIFLRGKLQLILCS